MSSCVLDLSGSCEHGNEHVGSMKTAEYNNELSNYQLLSDYSV
jgi:hypothetical protein